MHHFCTCIFALAVLLTANCVAAPVLCEGHAKSVDAVAFTPDGKLAVSGGYDHLVRIWDTSTGKEVRSLPIFAPDAEHGIVSDLALSPDGQTVAVAAWGQPVRLWNVAIGEQTDKMFPVASMAYGLAFSPDGSKLAVAENEAIKVWEVQTGKVLNTFEFGPPDIGRARGVTFSPSGEFVSAALNDYGARFHPSAPKIRSWNIVSGNKTFTGWERDDAFEVAYSPDGNLLAATGKVVELWNVITTRSVRRFVADEKGTFCVAFSPDGLTIATGGSDTVIKFWDIATGKMTGTLKGHNGHVRDLCYSRDGKLLASAGTDKSMLIWTLSKDTRPE